MNTVTLWLLIVVMPQGMASTIGQFPDEISCMQVHTEILLKAVQRGGALQGICVKSTVVK